MVGGGDPFYLKFFVNQPPLSEIADFELIFARSASAVTPREKSSIHADSKSTTRFPMSRRWTSYIVAKTREGGGGGAQKRSVHNSNNKLQ